MKADTQTRPTIYSNLLYPPAVTHGCTLNIDGTSRCSIETARIEDIYYNCKPKTTYTLCQVQHSISRTLLLHTIWCAGGGWENPLVHSTTYIRRALLCTNILESSAFFFCSATFHNQNTSIVVSAWIVCKPCRCTSTALSVHNSTATTFTHAKHK